MWHSCFNRIKATETASELAPLAWSPDGTTPAYQEDRRLWLIEADRQPRQLTTPAGDQDVDVGASWSPDGETLAFTRLVAQPPFLDFFTATAALLDLSTGAVRPAQEDAIALDWSPDGRWISYVADPYGPSTQAGRVGLVSPEGEQQSLRRQCDTTASWSPSGEQLACTAVDGATSEVVTIDITTNVVQSLVDYGATPTWSADGSTIFYAVSGQPDVHTGIWATPVEGGEPRLLVGPQSPFIKQIQGPVVRPAPITRVAGPTRMETAVDVSDIDLAYLASDDFDPLQFMGEVVLALGTEQVDLADLSRANGLFRYEAARDGIRLFGDPEQHMDFRIRALRFWFDASPIIDAAYEETLAGLG